MHKIKNKEFINAYDALCNRHDRLKIFCDFVKMSAISIYNVLAQNQEMEKEYLKTINSYNKEEQLLFIKMFSELIMMFEESKEVVDLLGTIYMEIKSKSNNLGQVFTPDHIAELMSEITIGDKESFNRQIEKNGFVFVLDPACGSGGLVLSYARALQKSNTNYQEYLLVDVTDISDICVYMTYIQLALYGIPAVVRCGNTLTQKMRFKMETPIFFLHYSKFRKFYMQNQKKIKENTGVTEKSKITNQKLLKKVTVKDNYQISLW